jgi:hypothetical protein
MAKAARANRTDTSATRRRIELPSPPAWVKPQLAKLVNEAPDGPDRLHEIKFDGYRMHARLDAGRLQIRRADARLSAPGLCVTPTLGAGLASHARTGTLFNGAGRRMRLDSGGS